MNAFAVLEAASAAGVHIVVDRGDLVLEANAPPPDEIIKALFSHKADIIALMKSPKVEWRREDWRALFSERADTAEFETGMSRPEAEKYAFECCVIEWLNQHCVPSDPACCAWCKQTYHPEHVIVPFGNNLHGHTWLHPECWSEWQKYRRMTAVNALEREGVRCNDRSSKSPMNCLTEENNGRNMKGTQMEDTEKIQSNIDVAATRGDVVDERMPVEQWLAIRKEAALKIDSETAEVCYIFAQTFDPYGINPNLPKEWDQIGREYFARSPESDIWVLFDDLPDDIRVALWQKHKYRLALFIPHLT